MNCEDIRKYIDDYILGELEPDIEIQINEHLIACVACKKNIEEKEAEINIFKKSRKFLPPKGLYSRVRSEVMPIKKEKKVSLWLWNLSKRLVYAVAVFFLGMVIMRTIDILYLKTKQKSKVEVKYETKYRVPFSDTVQFYSAPPKNLARI